jgi:catechol 2,3-dioxygenase-like lactoylglutathione lyase family enzyme
MAPSLTHLALHTPDIDATVAFYESYCGLGRSHVRGEGDDRVVWLAESGRETRLVLVLIDGGPGRSQASGDYSHLGFGLSSDREVDRIADRARLDGCLVWPARREPPPVGYFCGVRDPAGNVVEFSHGQPLGPDASAGA